MRPYVYSWIKLFGWTVELADLAILMPLRDVSVVLLNRL